MSHIKTAHDIGVQKALKEAGYASLEDVQKQAEAVGLIKPAEKTASPLDALLGNLVK